MDIHRPVWQRRWLSETAPFPSGEYGARDPIQTRGPVHELSTRQGRVTGSSYQLSLARGRRAAQRGAKANIPVVTQRVGDSSPGIRLVGERSA